MKPLTFKANLGTRHNDSASAENLLANFRARRWALSGFDSKSLRWEYGASQNRRTSLSESVRGLRVSKARRQVMFLQLVEVLAPMDRQKAAVG